MLAENQINRIAFIDSYGQLGIVSPDGGSRHMLTAEEERVYRFPAWSPDGQSIAVIGNIESNADICVASQIFHDQPAWHSLFKSELELPIYLSWSPDSRYMTFLATHFVHGLALHLLRNDGSEPAPIQRSLVTGAPCFWDWHPNSREVLAHVKLGSAKAQLLEVTLDREGYNTQRRYTTADLGYFQVPGIAPSGRYRAYAERIESPMRSRLVVDREGNKQVLAEYEGVVTMTWNPIEEQLAFLRVDDPANGFYGSLYLWEATSRHTRRLVEEETVVAFFWSPNGRKIAYLTMAEGSPQSQAPTLNVSTNGYAQNGYMNGDQSPSPSAPSLSRPQNELYFELYVVDVDTGHTQKLTKYRPNRLFVEQFLAFFGQYALSHRIWSPASDALVLPMLYDRLTQICVVSTEDGTVTPIADGLMASWSWQ